MTQVKAYLMEKNIATNCSQVTVPALAGWTKKPFGHWSYSPHITKLQNLIVEREFIWVND